MIYAICFILGFICSMAVILPIAIFKVKQEISITNALVESLLKSLDEDEIESMVDVINENETESKK